MEEKVSLLKLFERCAYGGGYSEVGHDVDYLFLNKGEELQIMFKPSDSSTDWIRNFWFFPKTKEPYKGMESEYKVHGGFLAAWKEVEDIVIDKIIEKKKSGEFRWAKITVVGYSHGGALAMLCHECVWFYRPDLRHGKISGYAFEAPRVLARFFVPKRLKERWENFFVIRNGGDIVTHMPPWIFRFTHVGELIKIKGDVSVCSNPKAPRCVKWHYPEVIVDGLKKAGL